MLLNILKLDKAKQESRSKDEALRKLEESMQHFENKARGKDQLHKNQLEKIKELENQLEMKTVLQSRSEKQVSHLTERLKGQEEVTSDLQWKVADCSFLSFNDVLNHQVAKQFYNW